MQGSRHNKTIIILNTALFFLVCNTLVSGQYISHVYKTIDSIDLTLNMYYPEGKIPSQPTPAIIFFFGGGWVNGNPSHFASQCEYLASLGIIAIAADYRTESKYGTTPLDCIADAKSSIRWLKANCAELMIDQTKIVAAGGSAGGHLALCCAILEDFNHADDNLSVSSKPDALVLFNPVVNTTMNGYGYEKFGSIALEASPLQQLKPGLPPTLIFQGIDDEVVKIADIRSFSEKAIANGDYCRIVEFQGKGHGFFNKHGDDDTDYWKTLLETEKFLRYKGFLPPILPIIEIE